MFVMINGEQRLIIGKATLLDDAIPTKEVEVLRRRKINEKITFFPTFNSFNKL